MVINHLATVYSIDLRFYGTQVASDRILYIQNFFDALIWLNTNFRLYFNTCPAEPKFILF